MRFVTQKLIRPTDLNANNTLFGGALLQWIDEAAGIYAMTKLNSPKVVTKFMSEIDFISSARQADVIEIGLEFVSIGTSSITFKCRVRNLFTRKTIISVEKIVFVCVDDQNRAQPHGITLERLKEEGLLKN